ncbi:hypothetical protein RRG08_059074 [Elysia crispata]|uniref:Uncharacterized protein n=1 Tax=Elysia crispata TaxID=231223 RepID=A0AAE1B9Z8_9GAST|nr:hypothetical protein RRG08_059074 [Elysia crispata]
MNDAPHGAQGYTKNRKLTECATVQSLQKDEIACRTHTGPPRYYFSAVWRCNVKSLTFKRFEAWNFTSYEQEIMAVLWEPKMGVKTSK